MVNRAAILSELKTLLTNLSIFKKIYTASTDIAKESSFPVAWVLLEEERFPDSTLQKTFRDIYGRIRICVKSNIGEDVLNPILDSVVAALQTNYTLNGACIELQLSAIETDGGVLYPYSIGDVEIRMLAK